MKVTIQENFFYKGRRYCKGEEAEMEDCAGLIARGLVELCAPKVHEKAPPIIEEPKDIEPEFGTIFDKPKRGRPKKK